MLGRNSDFVRFYFFETFILLSFGNFAAAKAYYFYRAEKPETTIKALEKYKIAAVKIYFNFLFQILLLVADVFGPSSGYGLVPTTIFGSRLWFENGTRRFFYGADIL